jgi:hypothetical protein
MTVLAPIVLGAAVFTVFQVQRRIMTQIGTIYHFLIDLS